MQKKINIYKINTLKQKKSMTASSEGAKVSTKVVKPIFTMRDILTSNKSEHFTHTMNLSSRYKIHSKSQKKSNES